MSFTTNELHALQAAKLDNLTKRVNADTWSDHMETLLKEWGEKAFALRWMHVQGARYWRKVDNRLNVLSILLGSIASMTSISSAEATYNPVVMYGVGALSMCGVFVQSIKRFYMSEQKASEHIGSARQYGKFHRTIALQLGMRRENRMSSEQIGDWALREYERIQQEAPEIQEHIIEEFKRTFDSSVTTYPDILKYNYTIEVHEAN